MLLATVASYLVADNIAVDDKKGLYEALSNTHLDINDFRWHFTHTIDQPIF